MIQTKSDRTIFLMITADPLYMYKKVLFLLEYTHILSFMSGEFITVLRKMLD